MSRISILVFAILVAGTGVASAQMSTYTKIDLQACTVVAQDRQSGSIAWSCPGLNGVEVWIAEGDLRSFVSFGPDADRQVAARQTLPPFNRINDTLEWRLDVDGKPYATILRWFTEFDDGREGQVLVVTRVGPGGSCHVAYVDALANIDANELARQAADLLSPEFDCESGAPVTAGQAGDSL